MRPAEQIAEQVTADDAEMEMIRDREVLEARVDRIVMGKTVVPGKAVADAGEHNLDAESFYRVDSEGRFDAEVPRYCCDDDATTNVVLAMVVQQGAEFRLSREAGGFRAAFVMPGGEEKAVCEATYGPAVAKASLALCDATTET